MDIQHDAGGTCRTLVDRSPVSALQWAVFVFCFLIMFLDGLDTVLIGFLAPYIGAEWQLAKGALTPAFTAGVVGLMIAGCVAGILADRVGRRPLLLGAVAVFGLANLATAHCASLEALVALRFVTGLGLGAAMPCAVTLVSEYAPARRRALIITSMYCGYTLGGAAVGWLTPIVTQPHGWRAMFIVGAVLPLALLPFLFWRLPESIAFLAERRRDSGAAAALLSRIVGRQVALPNLPERQVAAMNPLGIILSPAYRARTGLLWLANGAGLLMTFTLINWLPSFLTFKHVPAQTAALSGASLQAGGALGALLAGWLMDRFGSGKTVVATYLG
ncbi:MAG TPA: MFS transporter, partial [Pseudoduganella sp.]